MDRHITVSIRGLLVAVLVSLALVIAFLLGGRESTLATAAEPDADGPTIEMVGIGEASAVPDEVTFTVSLGVTRDDLDDAMKQSSEQMRRILGVLTRQGVEKRDVQTTGLSMSPQYKYSDNQPPELTGYRVTQKASVVVRKLTAAGSVIGEVVEKGGNGVRVSGIRLQVGDPTASTGEARSAAVAEATAKAEQYAEATGQELGRVIQVREVGAPVASEASALQAYDRDLSRLAMNKVMPIRAGESTRTVQVRILWSLGE